MEYTPIICWIVLFGLSCLGLVAVLRCRGQALASTGKATGSNDPGGSVFLWWRVALCMVCAAGLGLLAPLALAFKVLDQGQRVLVLGQMGVVVCCVGLGALLVWRKSTVAVDLTKGKQ